MVLIPLTEVGSAGHKTDSWRIQKPTVDYSSCIRCMICWKFCPDNAIDISVGGDLEAPNERVAGLEAPVINYDYCKGCGICANECPEKCIEMSIEESVMQ